MVPVMELIAGFLLNPPMGLTTGLVMCPSGDPRIGLMMSLSMVLTTGHVMSPSVGRTRGQSKKPDSSPPPQKVS